MSPVSNILFDIGNVILDLDIEGARARISDFRTADFSDEQFIERITPAALEFETGSISSDAFLARIQEHTRDEITTDDIIEVWNGMLRTIPAFRLGMLKALRSDYTLLALSNTNALHLQHFHKYLESAHGITHFETNYFDDVYYSHLIRLRKPSRAVFLHVIDDALITPQRTLFIDDLEENLAVAADLGFQTLHSPADAEVAESLKVLGYY